MGFFPLLLEIMLFVMFSLQQYQQTTHLKGRGGLYYYQPRYGSAEIYDSENYIGSKRAPTTFMTSDLGTAGENELYVFFGQHWLNIQTGYSNEAWVFSVEKRQWAFLRGVKDNSNFNQLADFSSLNTFDDANQPPSRWFGKGWRNGNIFTFFGGHGYTQDGYQAILNSIWQYDRSKNMYSVIQCNGCGLNSNSYYSVYSNIDEYDPNNIPGARFDHTVIPLNEDEVLLIGGSGFLVSSVTTLDMSGLPDWWIFSNSRMQWKYCGGDITIPYSEIVLGTTNVYSSSNTIGNRRGAEAVRINDEEILIFGGRFEIESATDYLTKVIQKYNITSNMWKKVTGEIGVYAAKGFGREYNSENFIGTREGHYMWMHNEEEIRIFGGFGNSGILYGEGYLNCEWSFHLKKEQFKYTGKSANKFPSRSAIFNPDNENEPYREDISIGSLRDFGAHYISETKELIVFGGYGSSLQTGTVDDVWRMYYGNICNLIEDTDPLVCLQRGKCIGYNFCECNDGFFGNNCELTKCEGLLSNDTEVCSKNGICIDSKCACFEYSPYNNPDCSINFEKQAEAEAYEQFISTLWIYISIPFIIIILISVIIIGVLIFFSIFFKQRKKLKQMDGIEDVELILNEARMEQNSNKPKININKSLFEVEYKDIKLISLIGEGSQCFCYMCEWKGNYCAYKSFRKESFVGSSNEESFYVEFEKEVKLYSSIHHPSILKFYGACVNPPNVGILLEYCKSGDLSTFLGQHKFRTKIKYSTNEKIRFFKEIASGLSHLHSLNIIHRDLKPENVLVDDNENTKIMDFGLSRLTSNEEKTMTKKVGTSFYMAPEVLNGRYSNKCDVFSFAILVFAVITEDFFPYGVETNESVVLHKVSKNPNFRPNIKTNDFKDCRFLIPFLKKNWDSNPEKRDSFEEVVRFFEKQKMNTKDRNQTNRKKSQESFEKEIMNLKKKNRDLNMKNKQLLKEIDDIKYKRNGNLTGHKNIKKREPPKIPNQFSRKSVPVKIKKVKPLPPNRIQSRNSFGAVQKKRSPPKIPKKEGKVNRFSKPPPPRKPSRW